MDKNDWVNKLESIEKVYDFKKGYKLLYCPWDTIGKSSTAFVSLNPGNAPVNANLRLISDERGNSYEVEKNITKSPINKQFLELCKFLNKKPSEILAGTVCPFRSSSWNSLTKRQRDAGIKIGQKFWSEVLLNIDLIVCVGYESANIICGILDFEDDIIIDSGWGDLKLKRYNNSKNQTMVSLPHLSTFKLFSRQQCIGPLREILKRK